MSELNDLYQEVILDHNRNPRNYGLLGDAATHHADGHNPLCGDSYTVHIKVADGRIEDIGFEGVGCAISKASASLMTEQLKGRSVVEAQAFFEQVHGMLTSHGEPVDVASMGKLAALSGVSEFPVRVKCATLAWHTLIAALNNQDGCVTTE